MKEYAWGRRALKPCQGPLWSGLELYSELVKKEGALDAAGEHRSAPVDFAVVQYGDRNLMLLGAPFLHCFSRGVKPASLVLVTPPPVTPPSLLLWSIVAVPMVQNLGCVHSGHTLSYVPATVWSEG